MSCLKSLLEIEGLTTKNVNLLGLIKIGVTISINSSKVKGTFITSILVNLPNY